MEDLAKWLQIFVLAANVISITYSATLKRRFEELDEKRKELEELKSKEERDVLLSIKSSVEDVANLTMVNSQIIIDSWTVIRANSGDFATDDSAVEEINNLIKDLKSKVYGSGRK